MRKRLVQAAWVACVAALCIGLAGCSDGGGTLDVSLTLSASGVVAPQDGTPVPVSVTIARSAGDANSITLAATGLPTGMQAQFVQPGTGSAGTVTLVASAAAPAGAYTVSIEASEGESTASTPLAVQVGIVATVGNTADTSLGVGGKIEQSLGVAFEPDNWRDSFLPLDWSALEAMGTEVMSVHTVNYIPMQANTGQASDWNFASLDANLAPAFAVGDHNPLFDIVQPPPFLNSPSNDGSGVKFVFNDANLQIFVQYCANLVRYYNAGGFDWGGQHFQAPPGYRIGWWAIFNEYDINGLLPTQYIQLYNAVVPAMLAVDPTIKIAALELADGDFLLNDPRNNLPYFVASPADGGVNAQVDAATLHLYPALDQGIPDAQVFAITARFITDVGYYYQELRSRPDLANVPVWVTESGVDSDYQNNGISHATGKPFVLDVRGTDAFNAAWQSYLFSQIGKAGCQRLLHWSFSDDAQYGLINENNNYPYLSYWVEKALIEKFPWNGVTPGPDILDLNATETSTVETLATRNSDGSVVVMMADHAVHSPNDDNGPGDPRTVIVDVTALGTFGTATQLTIDTNTDTVNGPAEVPITPAARMTVSLGGYGVTFVTLHP